MAAGVGGRKWEKESGGDASKKKKAGGGGEGGEEGKRKGWKEPNWTLLGKKSHSELHSHERKGGREAGRRVWGEETKMCSLLILPQKNFLLLCILLCMHT